MGRDELLMEKLLDSTISPEESSELNHRLSKSVDLNRELIFRRELNSMIQSDDERSLRNTLNWAKQSVELDEAVLYRTQFRRKAKRLLFATATVAGIALGGWSALSLLGNQPTAEDLFNSHYNPYPPVSVHRDSPNMLFHQQLNDAMHVYQQGKHSEAAQAFEELLAQNPEAVIVKFYLGISYLELSQYHESTLLLADVVNSESIYSEQALWYYALGHLAQGSASEALVAFEELSSSESTLGRQAKKLTAKLSEIE